MERLQFLGIPRKCLWPQTVGTRLSFPPPHNLSLGTRLADSTLTQALKEEIHARLPDSFVKKGTSVKHITNSMSEATPQENTTECSNYENELPKLETAEKADTRASVSGRSKERSECTTTKIGQSKTVTEKIMHSTVTITKTKTLGMSETKTESKVTETITITEEGGQTTEMTNTTNEEESSGQSGVKSKTECATTPAPQLGAGANSAKKGKLFEQAFQDKVEQLKLKCDVLFQETITLKKGRKRKKCTCRPDVIFKGEEKAAIVELKDYSELTYLQSNDVDKLVRDMAAVKEVYECTKVWGYIYIRGGKVSDDKKDYAEKKGVIIVREAKKTAETLAHYIDEKLQIE